MLPKVIDRNDPQFIAWVRENNYCNDLGFCNPDSPDFDIQIDIESAQVALNDECYVVTYDGNGYKRGDYVKNPAQLSRKAGFSFGIEWGWLIFIVIMYFLIRG